MAKKKKKKVDAPRPKYCFISFNKEDLEIYGPGGPYGSCSKATEQLHQDLEDIAAKMDYTYDDIFVGCIAYAEREIIELWKQKT